VTHVHDRALLDALLAMTPVPFAGEVWRITRKGRDALRGSSAHGRWSPAGEIEVLYTSLERDGALAEIGYRLSLEPVWPSRLAHEIHAIDAATERTLRFADLAGLEPLGVDPARYASLDYGATQAIAAAAHFLELDGLLVPSARAPCANLVVFLDRVAGGARLEVTGTASVDWDAWRKGRVGA
jgi:RES domain-containing protein